MQYAETVMLLTLGAVAGVHVVQRMVATRSVQGQEMSSLFSGRISVVADNGTGRQLYSDSGKSGPGAKRGMSRCTPASSE